MVSKLLLFLLYCMMCTATITPRSSPAKNQDASWVGYCNSYKVMAVADGLGSYELADLAAMYVCSGIAEYSQKQSSKTFDMQSAFMYAQNVLKAKANEYLQKNNLDSTQTDLFATTLIVAVETEDEFICGYCGNGGIFHIRGNFDHFQNNQYLPWNAINYLNPHTVQNAQGKEALYKYLSLQGSMVEYTPTILRISKDKDWYGDMLLICTDGIFSNDQVQVGKDSKNNLWIQGEKTITLLYEYLKPLPTTEKKLAEQIEQYLDYLRIHKLLDDDATLAICISQTMLKYHLKR